MLWVGPGGGGQRSDGSNLAWHVSGLSPAQDGGKRWCAGGHVLILTSNAGAEGEWSVPNVYVGRRQQSNLSCVYAWAGIVGAVVSVRHAVTQVEAKLWVMRSGCTCIPCECWCTP